MKIELFEQEITYIRRRYKCDFNTALQFIIARELKGIREEVSK